MGIEELIEELRAKIDSLCNTVKNKLAIAGNLTIDELIEAVKEAYVIGQWNLEFTDKMTSPVTVTLPEISIDQMMDNVVISDTTGSNNVISETFLGVTITPISFNVYGMTESVEINTIQTEG